ncbi:MAG: nicotinate-nucleotide--dimethylbenzimidazole phosphoribosyltransferase, partial [Clostridia bacterium]
VANNIIHGQATVCKMSKIARADVFPIDVGMKTEVENLRTEKTMRGTNNFAKTQAMSNSDAEKAILTGMNLVKELKNSGYKLIAVGEMGIGNTTTSSAMAAVLTNSEVKDVTSKGAGLSNEGVKHKIQVIENAIKRLEPNGNIPLDVLTKVGGLDIACMCGVFLGGAENGVPLVIDGFISSVACLLATKFNENVIDYVLPSHMSNEGGAKIVMNFLGLKPPITAEMALGEGTGAVALMPLLDMALVVLNEMVTFEATNIEEYKPL